MQITCGVLSNKNSSIYCCSNGNFCNWSNFSDLYLPFLSKSQYPVSSSYASLSRNIRTAMYDWSSEAILISLISSVILFFCILAFFLFFICFARKGLVTCSCRCKQLRYTGAVQCSDRNRNVGKFLTKPFYMKQDLNICSSMHCPYFLTCCSKICVSTSLNLTQTSPLKYNPFSHHVLQLNTSSSFPQKPLESAAALPSETQPSGTMSSGSGSGVPFLVQATIARQISLQECIGKGRYGEVWRGIYRGENVAVKIFSSRDEASWARETHIYSSVLLRHENILSYYASDITSRYGCTQLWIISHYHPYGSLYDFLQAHVVDTIAALRLAKTAASGLCYLHSYILGLQGKPAIVHRDIKSKNILVQANGTCSIGDLGLAVMQAPGSTEMDVGQPNHMVGTKRYMAPEILADDGLEECPESGEGFLPHDFEISAYLQSKNRINDTSPVPNTLGFSFEELKAADVYAFGLVLWEIFRRCLTERGEVHPPHVPYWDKVSADPSFAEMRRVVHVEGERPPISERWQSSKVLIRCASLMQECWHAKPDVRLPILRIKKTLDETFSEAVKEIGESVVPDQVIVISDPRTQADSGINSRSHGSTFQCTSVTPYYQTVANGSIRSPREVLALGRIMRCPSEILFSEESSTTKKLKEGEKKVVATASNLLRQEESQLL
ncbi:Activin receptor type-1 [Echinococcus granulosus]|nr:Activin receptor type-1 [Echinococcus granulosus]